ncbi:uncharacterized protein [Rutidosis leptorrhynchoides]|uniref:uncharacterized protein n=1 Tax=Rutidosis leptorrhynchoides TaxID=125765 RepID=UPI003A98F57B
MNIEDTNSSNNPLYLHQNDHPGLVLISRKLTGSDNYGNWKRSMMIALNAKNKLKILTCEYREPEKDSILRPLWERNNDMIISWILNTLTEEISNSLNCVSSAKDVWLELQEHYSQIDAHRVYQLANDVAQLKQNNSSIEAYYHKLKGFWDETDSLEAPYMYTCSCTCENGKQNGEREQRKRLFQFLMGLDDSYSNVRGQILLIQPLPTTAKAYGMIKHEEKQREGLLPKPNAPAVMSITSNTPRSYANNNHQKFTRPLVNTERRSTFKTGIKCSTCFREGHTSDECYKNIGYPIGHPLHGKFPQKSNNKGRAINSIFTDGVTSQAV